MKKDYVTPEIIIEEIVVEDIIMASGLGDFTDFDELLL